MRKIKIPSGPRRLGGGPPSASVSPVPQRRRPGLTAGHRHDLVTLGLVSGILAVGAVVIVLAAWAMGSSSGRWFLIGAGAVAVVAVAGGVALDRHRTKRLRELIDYLGLDLEVRKAAGIPEEHRVRIERAQRAIDGHRLCVRTGRLP